MKTHTHTFARLVICDITTESEALPREETPVTNPEETEITSQSTQILEDEEKRDTFVTFVDMNHTAMDTTVVSTRPGSI